jgi:transcriptional regulator with XRE-family HTH domain
MRDLLAFGQSQRLQRPSPLLRTMVGDVLRRTRLSQGRTLADVAGSARISMQYLSELERGRKEASSEILAALCTALRLDLSELLAAVGHELLDQRARRPGVVRIGAFRDGGARPPRRLLPPDTLTPPADGPMADGPPADGPLAGLLADGPLADGLLADGPLADGLLVDGGSADGAAPSDSLAPRQRAGGEVSSPARGAAAAVCGLAA